MPYSVFNNGLGGAVATGAQNIIRSSPAPAPTPAPSSTYSPFNGSVSGAFQQGAYGVTNAGQVASGNAVYNSSGGITGTTNSGQNLSSSSGGGFYPTYGGGGGGGSVSYTPQTSSVSAPAINNTPTVVLPSAPNVAQYPGTPVGNNIAVGANPNGTFNTTNLNPDGTPKTATDVTTTENTPAKTLADYIKQASGLFSTPPSAADSYNRAQQESQQIQAQQQRNATQSVINGIMADTTARISDYRHEIGVNGGTVGGFGGREAEINREAMIKLLPLQAQLATDQANLELAQTHMNTLFKIYSEDAQSKYNAYKDQVSFAYGLFSKDEQRQLDANLARQKSAVDSQNNWITNQFKIASEASKNGQGALATKILQVKPPTYGSATYAQDEARFEAQIAQYGGQINISTGGGSSGGSSGGTSGGVYSSGNAVVDSWAERIQNGSAKITDIPASQAALRNQVTVALQNMGNSLTGKPTTTELGKAALATANDLLIKFNNGQGTSAVGKSGILNSFGYGFIPGTDRANFVTDFNSLKSQMALEAVRYLKGQGSVSDAERALLSQAVTKLNLSQSEGEFKTTLENIISKLSSGITTSGGSIAAESYILPDGTVVHRQADGSYQ